MSADHLLIDCIYFLCATLTFVPIFRYLGLGSTLGYLAAGLTLGPDLLGIIDNSNFIFKVSNVGLIFLLFAIGLELTPRRLNQLKSKIVIDGLSQFTLTFAVMFAITYSLNSYPVEAFIISAALALSSTAFVLHYLKESKQLTVSYGQSSFGILLFQDLAMIPMLTLIPILAGAENVNTFNFSKVAISIGGITALILFAKYALKPIVSFVHHNTTFEVFTALCLLIVIGSSMAVHVLGLSEALGAFMAGIFLSDSEFKQEVENVILPFKGMLIGTFFMSIGLQFNFSIVQTHTQTLVMMTVLFLVIKAIIMTAIGHKRLGSIQKGFKLGLIMAQGSEFGLVILATALNYKLLNTTTAQVVTSSIILSLFLAPVLAKMSEMISIKEPVVEETPDNVIDLQEAKSDVQVKPQVAA